MKDHSIYLRHILEAIDKIENYINDKSFDEFVSNDEKKDVVVRNLEIIGEAASKIGPNIRKTYSKIPWRDIVDMRNRLIHLYFSIDHNIVWDVIKNELPILKVKMKDCIDTAK